MISAPVLSAPFVLAADLRARNWLRVLTGWVLVAAVTACSSNPGFDHSEHYANHPAPVATTGTECARLLALTQPDIHEFCSSEELSLAVWNVRKAVGDEWEVEFAALASDHDLVLLQEFALSAPWNGGGYLSFSPGYTSPRAQTGVAMLSRAAPLARCELSGKEPLLRTSKATAIAEFPLDDGRTLVVVNVHAVNFALGLVNFSAQIRDAVQAVADHQGPLIFSGDFNTWRGRRQQLVAQELDALGLRPVKFGQDLRKKVFGQPLDHIYVRDVEVLDATTRSDLRSDHNPMFARLRL
jgi:endonuclease/exonuclease/phosphatase (EEP) superfamily protein YafD